jgi:hypothetical protein
LTLARDKKGTLGEPIIDVYQLFHKLMINFQIKNQKDKEQSFIFPIKKNECSTGNFIFLKNSNARHRRAISRVLKR